MTKKPKTDAELIDAFASGIEERHYVTVFLQSERFVVFKVKGHSSWSGVGCPWQYVKTKYMLARKGDWWMTEGNRTWEGRVAALPLKEALRRSELFNKVYGGDFSPSARNATRKWPTAKATKAANW